jgi:hypothetical protein
MSRVFYNEEYFKQHPKYGMLTVVNFKKIRKKKSLLGFCDCLCDCGKMAMNINNQALRNGHIKSCGCQQFSKRENHASWKGCGEISACAFWRIRDNARKRKHKFSVTVKELWELFLKQDRKCALTKLPLCFNSTNHKKDGTASLDRIDSNKEYTIDNVQWVHREINYMKQAYSQNHFIKLCKLVTENNA